MTKPSWLPLVMPRPELFREPGEMPDVIDAPQPHLLELRRASRDHFEIHCTRRLNSLDPPRTMTVTPGRFETATWWDTAQRQATQTRLCTLFISLPIFTSVRIFQGGSLNYGYHVAETQGDTLLPCSDTDYQVIITRSFLTWTTRSLCSNPLHRTDRMVWEGQVPRPDFPDWAEPVPAQVIVPIERPHLSAHRQIEIKSLITEDLRFLSTCKGWGEPLSPLTIDMPETFDDE